MTVYVPTDNIAAEILRYLITAETREWPDIEAYRVDYTDEPGVYELQIRPAVPFDPITYLDVLHYIIRVWFQIADNPDTTYKGELRWVYADGQDIPVEQQLPPGFSRPISRPPILTEAAR